MSPSYAGHRSTGPVGQVKHETCSQQYLKVARRTQLSVFFHLVCHFFSPPLPPYTLYPLHLLKADRLSFIQEKGQGRFFSVAF